MLSWPSCSAEISILFWAGEFYLAIRVYLYAVFALALAR